MAPSEASQLRVAAEKPGERTADEQQAWQTGNIDAIALLSMLKGGIGGVKDEGRG
jgi:hypothetical protein